MAVLAQGTLVSPTQRCPSSNVSVVTRGVLVAVVFPWQFGRKPRVESRGMRKSLQCWGFALFWGH